MVVDVEVVYRWSLMHRVNGRNTNQKRIGKKLPAQQDAVPKNLALGEALVVCGAPTEFADDKSQYMNLGHAVSCKTSAIDHEPTIVDPIDLMEGVLHADQTREGHDPEDTVEHEKVAKESKSSRGLRDAGEFKEPSSVQRTKLPVRATEENDVLLVECPFSRMGLDSQPTPSNVMLSMPLLDGDCISCDVEGRNCEPGLCHQVLSEAMALVAHTMPKMLFLVFVSTVAPKG
ncbi:hypothetical protein Nepgr_007909 [Nepenthes gracilis]|uniref:Uncharacterized protein n=1 Tax=Nepenthes gracilis TaxID=150966 RepID=A0AAD3S842_NEPGR|nr:hypothetical protein Nepgr_007909 [Nepenthes gracilis]